MVELVIIVSAVTQDKAVQKPEVKHSDIRNIEHIHLPIGVGILAHIARDDEI